MSRPTLLIDGDLVLHRVLAGNETPIDWGDGVSTLHTDHKSCIRNLRQIIKGWTEMFDTKDVRVAISGSHNFRKDLCEDYKATRTTRKPLGFKPIKDWLFSTGKCRSVEGIEADDLLGIWATQGHVKRPVIISDDKDLLQIPCEVYSPRKQERFTISEQEGDRWHLHQTLVGDRTDNYKGCPGIGEVKAKNILDQSCTWETVLECFRHQGLSDDEALLQARLARILRAGDFDFKAKQPILWRPHEVL